MAGKKRGNGEGGISRRKDGRWEGRYTDASGKHRSVYGATRKEVAGKLVEALAHKDDAPAFVPADITVREFLEQYEDVAVDTMKRRSFEAYQSIAKVHLLPAFGNTKLKKLNREQVQRMYSRKRDAGLSPLVFAGFTVRCPPLSTWLFAGVTWNTISAKRYHLREYQHRR